MRHVIQIHLMTLGQSPLYVAMIRQIQAIPQMCVVRQMIWKQERVR
jgi:hypothetical protein